MVSAERVWSWAPLVSKTAVLLFAVGACSSAETPTAQGTNSGAQGTPAASAGVSGGAATAAGAGRAATSTGVAIGAAGAKGPMGASGSAGISASNTNPIGSTGDVTNPGAAGRAGGKAVMSSAGAGATSGAAGASAATAGAGASTAASGCVGSPITADMRSRYENMNDAYYTKYASANGMIVATGDKVVDYARVRYGTLLSEMISNDKVRQAMMAEKMWFTMIGEEEQLSSLPQINRDYGMSLNQRARGLGGLTPPICAEENIMCLPGDRWNGDCICPHETGHTLYSSGIQPVKELSDRLTAITDAARSSGRLSNAYVWMDGDESGMMAWGVQTWYNSAIDGMMGGYHSAL